MQGGHDHCDINVFYMCVGVSVKWIAIGELVQSEKAAPADAAI